MSSMNAPQAWEKVRKVIEDWDSLYFNVPAERKGTDQLARDQWAYSGRFTRYVKYAIEKEAAFARGAFRRGLLFGIATGFMLGSVFATIVTCWLGGVW